MILLANNNSTPAIPYSNGDGSNPITARATFDGSGTPPSIVAESDDPVYLWANDDTGLIDNYSNVGIEIKTPEPSVIWEVSIDNVNWVSVLTIGTIDVSSVFQAIRIYVRMTALNDGSLVTDNYVAAKIQLNAISNPV